MALMHASGVKIPVCNAREPYGSTRVPKRPTTLWGAMGWLTEGDIDYLARHVFDVKPSEAHLILVEALLMQAAVVGQTEPGGHGMTLVWLDSDGVVKVPVFSR